MMPDEEIQSDESLADDLTKVWDESNAETTAEPTPDPVIEAPQHWSQQDRDAFASLPDEAKPLYLEKVKSLESGYNRKFESIASDRRTYESVGEALAPVAHLFNEENTPAGFVGKMVQIGVAMESDPAATLKALAASYGVDLGAGGDLDEMKATQYRAAFTDLRNATYDAEWSVFQSITPGAAHLKTRIGNELAINPPQPGESIRQAIERAYNEVKWTVPEIRQSLIQAEKKAEDAERQRKADLAKAKKAGDRVPRGKTSPGIQTRVGADTWREELERVWDGAGA